MQREREFIFWDIENGKHINPENVLIQNKGKITFTGDFNIFKKHPNLSADTNVLVLEFTGFKDYDGRKIYEGDTLIDLEVELEEGVKLEDTQQQVFWCKKTGAWKLDNTFSQNKKEGWLLYKELQDFKFKIHSNVHYNKLKLASDSAQS